MSSSDGAFLTHIWPLPKKFQKYFAKEILEL